MITSGFEAFFYAIVTENVPVLGRKHAQTGFAEVVNEAKKNCIVKCSSPF